MGENTREPAQSERAVETASLPSLSDERLYRALASTQRRRLLYLLLDEDGASTLEKLATMLVGWEATATGTMKTTDARHRILVELHHRDLPLLSELGLLSYDPDDSTVSLEDLDRPVVQSIARSVDSDHSSEP